MCTPHSRARRTRPWSGISLSTDDPLSVRPYVVDLLGRSNPILTLPVVHPAVVGPRTMIRAVDAWWSLAACSRALTIAVPMP